MARLPLLRADPIAETIMMLANIVNGQSQHNSEGRRTTLIVASPALITQWMNEINKHTLQERKSNWRPLKVLKWHAKSKPCTNDKLGGIPGYDIVYVLPGVYHYRNGILHAYS
jgi:SNF2-related domain